MHTYLIIEAALLAAALVVAFVISLRIRAWRR